MRAVLAVCPHPDDEAIGCGGALRRHHLNGDRVEVVFLTSGEGGGHGLADAGTVREAEAKVAADILGVDQIDFWRQPDGLLEGTVEVMERLGSSIERSLPDVIYAPHPDESHPDHRATAALVGRVLREISGLRPQWRQFEIWTPLREIDHIVDISDVVDAKREAIAAYESQCSIMRLDEAILALNRYRGEMHSWPGGDYAEVYTFGRVS